MNDFTEAIKLLKDLGVIQIFSIPLAFLVFAFLFKKFLINGTGKTFANIGSVLKEIAFEFINTEKERVKSQAAIDFKLGELCEKFEEVMGVSMGNRQIISDRVNIFENILREHITETRNLLLLLKKKSDPVQENLDKVDTQYFKQEVKP